MDNLGQMGLLFLFVGGVFILIAIREAAKKRKLLQKGAYVDATVVKTVCEELWKGYIYHPMLEFEVNGQKQTVKYQGSPKPRYKDGEKVRIQYLANANNVGQVLIVGDKSGYKGALACALVGVITMAFGASRFFF